MKHIRTHISIITLIFLFSFPLCSVQGQQEETNIVALLQSALNTAIKTFNSQNQPEAILQLNQIIDICQENMAGRELSEEELKILAEAYEYRGRAFYNIGETEKSQTDFQELIKINPRFQLDTTLVSPKIISLFDKIKNSMVGNLAVFSTPSGSEVYISGKFLSLTPMYATELLKGDYVLEVKHKGYDVYQENITILSNTPLEKEVVLTANTGTCLFYTVPPEAKIYIDDQFVGSTFGQAAEDMSEFATQNNLMLSDISAPLTIEYVEPGTHRLEIRRECFEPIIKSISIEIRAHEFEPFIMEESKTSIQVNSKVAGASVYLNDAFKGITPLTLEDVCTGEYILSVKKENVGKWFQKITLKRGEPQIFDTTMRPSVHYFGILNADEREPGVVERVEEKLDSIFSNLKSINYSRLPTEKMKNLENQLGISMLALTQEGTTNAGMNAKQKLTLLADLGKKLDSELFILAILPKEKLQRHVVLELYSIHHEKPDQIRLTFNDPDALEHFSNRMDAEFDLFKNWIGLVSIDTFIHDGLVCAEVLPESPAQQAGLEDGDIILKIDNNPIESNREFHQKLISFKVGAEFKVSYSRDGLIKATGIKVSRSPIELPRNNRNILYNKTMADLKQRIKLEKDEMLLNFYKMNLGFCFMHFNNWQKAIEDAFSQTSFPSGSGISSGTLNYYIAQCYQKLGYREEAIKYYRDAAAVKGATLGTNDGPSVAFLAEKKLAELTQ